MNDDDERELIARAAASDLVGARVTGWFATKKEVQAWQNWFESRGVVSVIEKSPVWPERYAVYRALPRDIAKKAGYL